jgi:hypothetical protein
MEFIVVSGPDVGRRVQVSSAARTVGRNATNDLTLTDSNVSSRHAVVRSLPGEIVELTDLSSTNGTFVDGERISSAVTVRPGATIQIGHNLLRIEGPAERPPTFAAPASADTPPLGTPVGRSVQDAGPVASGNIEMAGHHVAGRDLHYHEGFRIRTRMRPSARRLLYIGISVACIGSMTSLVSILLFQQEVFGKINSQPDLNSSDFADFQDEAVFFAIAGLGGLVMFIGMVMVVASLVMRRERIRVPVGT